MRLEALACLLAAACWHPGGASPHGAAANPHDDALAYIPLDAEIVIVADGARMRGSAVWQRVDRLVGGSLGPARARYRERCGYDPLALDRATVAAWNVKTQQASMIVVVRGIDPERFEACMRGELRATATRDGDTWHVEVPFVQRAIQLATIGTTAVAYIAEDASADKLHDLLRLGAPLRHSDGFAKLVADLPDDAALWAVARATPERAILTFSSAVSFDDGITLVARATFADPSDAAKVRAFASQVPSQYGKVEVSVDGAAVRVRARVTGDQIETALGKTLGGLFR